jgi:hypothetical protein
MRRTRRSLAFRGGQTGLVPSATLSLTSTRSMIIREPDKLPTELYSDVYNPIAMPPPIPENVQPVEHNRGAVTSR